VKEFFKKYSNPYNPGTDDYNILPFQENIDNASKSSAIYNMHMYWTKQDPYVVQKYIEHYTKPGDIVLDAFAGTGMTGVAAMMSGRHAVLCEISPACIHIAKNYTTPIEPRILQKEFNKLIEKCGLEIKPLYKTQCHNCKNDNAQIANTILSDVLRCPRCGVEVLFAGDGRWQKMKEGEKFKHIKCNNCNHEFTKANADFIRVEPIEIRVDCDVCKVKGEKKAKPLNEKDWELYLSIEGGPTKVVHEGDDVWTGYKFEPVERFFNETGTKVYNNMLREQRISYIPPRIIPYWYPKDIIFPKGYNTRQPLKRGITHPYQMFSRRNLIALSILWEHINKIEGENIKDKLKFVFTGILFNSTLQRKWKPDEKGGTLAGTLYIPSLMQERTVLTQYIEKMKSFIENININFDKSNVYLDLCSATKLTNVPTNSVDYAYYDPPYGANINYSELNIMWEAWLGSITDTKDEIIENDAQSKGRQEYEQMMTQALQEAYRVLKPGRWLSIVYSYSDPSMYRSVQRMAHNAGFVDEGEVLHINSAMKTKSQLDSDKTQQRYLVINFKKPKNGERKELNHSGDIELQVINIIKDYLIKHPGRTRDHIYDQVIKSLFTSVKIQTFNLDEILKNFFRKVGDEWFAPGTLLERKQSDESQHELWETSKNESSEKEIILQLQEFLRKHKLVPYSEVREFCLRKLNLPTSLDLNELLESNFIIENGKIRLPNIEEQLSMQDVALQYKKRKILRFLDVGLDHYPDQAELLEWLTFCYENKMYKDGLKLFELIEESSIPEDAYNKAKKIAEVCKLKI